MYLFLMKSFQIYELVGTLLYTEQQRKLVSEKKWCVGHVIAKPADNCTDESGGTVPDCNILRNGHIRSSCELGLVLASTSNQINEELHKPIVEDRYTL